LLPLKFINCTIPTRRLVKRNRHFSNSVLLISVKRTFFFVNREITDLFSMKRNQYYPFTTLISGCDELFKRKILDKASRTQQELLAELTATQWQQAVFVFCETVRQILSCLIILSTRGPKVAPCADVVNYTLSCEYVVANKSTYLFHVVRDICSHFEI
jgi:hypothetical protein